MSPFNYTSTTAKPYLDCRDRLLLKAFSFIQSHYDEHLDREQLLSRTLDYVQSIDTVSQATAESIAMSALCEFESKQTQVVFDVDRSTSTMLVFRDNSQRGHQYFSVAEVWPLIQAAALKVKTPAH